MSLSIQILTTTEVTKKIKGFFLPKNIFSAHIHLKKSNKQL